LSELDGQICARGQCQRWRCQQHMTNQLGAAVPVDLAGTDQCEGFAAPPDFEGFARAIFKGWPEPWGETLDGFELQELGEKHGVLVAYEMSKPCGEHCGCAEFYGEDDAPWTCYYLAPEAVER